MVIAFLWVALKLGLAWFVVLLALFCPPLAQIPRLLRICLLGMVICGPAGYFNSYWLEAMSASLSVGEGRLLATATLWILVAPIEELLKYAIVRSAAGRAPKIEHPREACLLAACSALGFATYENYFYMTQAGYNVIHVRGWLCTAGHMLWSCVWGYYLGLAWMVRAPAKLAVAEGIILAALAHGTYNFLCTSLPGVGLIVPIATVALLGHFFATRLWTGKHTPWLSTLSRGGVPLSRLRFPPPGETTQRRAVLLLEQMDDDDQASRREAARHAATCEHQQVYARLRSLERDPDGEVRAAASASVARLTSRLRAIGERAQAEDFSPR